MSTPIFLPKPKMEKALKELQQSLQPYSLLWSKWITYSHCALTETDIYIIQVHLSNDFRFIQHQVVMFYNKPDKIYEITKKLNSGYVEFQDWVITKFLATLIKIAVQQGMQSFLEKPIVFLNLSNELKKCLLNFGFETLLEIVEGCNDNDLSGENYFRNPSVFKNVIEFVALKEIGQQSSITEYV